LSSQPPWVGAMIRVCTATAPEARLPFSRLHDWLFTGGVDLAYVLGDCVLNTRLTSACCTGPEPGLHHLRAPRYPNRDYPFAFVASDEVILWDWLLSRAPSLPEDAYSPGTNTGSAPSSVGSPEQPRGTGEGSKGSPQDRRSQRGGSSPLAGAAGGPGKRVLRTRRSVRRAASGAHAGSSQGDVVESTLTSGPGSDGSLSLVAHDIGANAGHVGHSGVRAMLRDVDNDNRDSGVHDPHTSSGGRAAQAAHSSPLQLGPAQAGDGRHRDSVSEALRSSLFSSV
jgi:hypothetical protein